MPPGEAKVRGSGSQTQAVSPTGKKKVKGAGDKKIAEDEFMAAAIGDVEWLKQSLRGKSGVNFDKNVSNMTLSIFSKQSIVCCLVIAWTEGL